MMILSHSIENKEAANRIQKHCLVYDCKTKIQYSQVTKKVLYAFEKDYPKDLDSIGVEYEEF